MRPLSNTPIFNFDTGSSSIMRARRAGLLLATTDGYPISSYGELKTKIAALNHANSHLQLLFRGQQDDHRYDINGERGGRGNLFPTILRPKRGVKREELLDERFECLFEAEKVLSKTLPIPDIQELRVVRWAILQHYEICETPLLDVTKSLSCALSFAIGKEGNENGYLFVLAVPLFSGSLSVSTESMTQVIDLAKICPPKACRPHFQDGILLGDYPEYCNRKSTHKGIGFVFNDFSCRLLAKFRLCNLHEWRRDGFTPMTKGMLFPDETDQWFPILQSVKSAIIS